MKQFYSVLVLAILTATPALAQQNAGVDISVSSGYIIPSSPMTFANYWKMQYGGSVSIGYPISESMSLVGMAEYYKFSIDQTGVSKGFDVQYLRDIWIFNDVSMKAAADPSSVVTASANIRMNPSSVAGLLSPFLTAGAGVMRFSMSEIGFPTTSVIAINGSNISMTAQRKIIGGTETEAFIQIGLGLAVHIAEPLDLMIEGRYAHGLSKGLGTSYIPVTAGIKYSL